MRGNIPVLWALTGVLSLYFLVDIPGSLLKGADAQVAWTPIFMESKTHKDKWTIKESGCKCPEGSPKRTNCACCVPNRGCQCSANPSKCSQCGLEDSCQRFCNVSISSRTVAIKSGLSWVELKSPSLNGPTSCWWRLQSAPGQRIELQIHRLIGVGSFDNDTQRCNGGLLQFSDGDVQTPSAQAVQLCASNNRFFPPVVIFGDTGTATLLLKLDEKTVGSQLLAYVSFSSADDPIISDPIHGGIRSQACDWTYTNCWNRDQKCIMTSPGFPGLFPPHRRCRYFITANLTSIIRIHFHYLSLPLCSSHHIAIWKGDPSLVKMLPNIAPPWQTLCKETGVTIDIDGGQGAVIEFRSGPTASPYLYSGFKASIQFIHSKQLQSALPTEAYRPNFFQGPSPNAGAGGKGEEIVQETPPPPPLVPALTIPPYFEDYLGSIGSSADLKERKQSSKLSPAEEPAGEPPRSSYESGNNIFSVPCGMSFDGDFTRGRIFRLVIPKNLAISPPSTNGGGSQSGGPSGGGRYKRFGVYEEPIRPAPRLPFKCNIEFHGRDSDIVQLAIFNFKFRGDNCSTRLDIYHWVDSPEKKERNATMRNLYQWDVKDSDFNRTDNKQLLGSLCGPSGHELKTFTSSHKKMSLAIMIYPEEETTSIIGTEYLEAAFRFHDEAVEGTVKPMSSSSCEVVYYGVTSANTGTIQAPDSPLLRLSTYPLVCAHSFLPSSNQSISLTLRRAGHEKPNLVLPRSKGYCRSFCSASGCQCESKHTPLSQIDHLLLVADHTPISCICGYTVDALPISFESHTPLTLVYHATAGGGKEFSYSATFNFKSKVTCANFSIEPPNGSKRWREIIGNGGLSGNKSEHHYAYFHCEWPISISPRYQLTLDFVSEEDEKDCQTWNITLWNRESRRRLDGEDTLISSFCPSSGKREVILPESVQDAFIRLVGVTLRAPQFEIRWKFNDIMLPGILTEKKVASGSSVLRIDLLLIGFISILRIL